ncbi:hypothetical protein [Parasediminibacterium sp. JCM 36343]|uniref:hypothetical protein n=1 Tax=Parasediminibacterium sp. JCM 36343 TaxID=3374279 RepID=UPI00397C5963
MTKYQPSNNHLNIILFPQSSNKLALQFAKNKDHTTGTQLLHAKNIVAVAPPVART